MASYKDENTPLLPHVLSNSSTEFFQPSTVWRTFENVVKYGSRGTRNRVHAKDLKKVDDKEIDNDGDLSKPVANWVHNIYSLPNIAIIMSYFSVGIVLTLTTVPVTFYLIEHLGASSTEFAVYTIVCKVPWSFKVFFGFISDAFPIHGLRRLPYLIIGWILHIACFLLLTVMVQPSVQWVIGAAFVSACGYLLSDVMTDSIMVERTKLESYNSRGTVQASGYIARAFGSAIGSMLGAILYNRKSWGWGLDINQIFLMNAVIPLVCVFPFLPFLKESVHKHVSGAKHVWRTHWDSIWSLVKRRAVWQPMLFVYIYNAMMVPNAAWNNFLLEGLHFSDFYLGIISIGGSLTAWLGLVIYKRYFMQSNWRNLYISTSIFNLMVSLTQIVLIKGWNKLLKIPNLVFAAGDDAAQDFLMSMQFLPVVIMYAAICPEGTEGTSYAMLTTLSNVADTVGFVIGDLLTQTWDTSNEALAKHEWSGLLKLTILTSIIQILPLSLISLLPADKAEQRKMQQSSESSRVGGAIFMIVLIGSIVFSILEAFYEIYL